MLEISSMAYYIILTFRPKAIEKVSFPSEMECKEWFEQLNLVCFGSVLGKTLHEALQVEPDAVKPDLLPSNATTNNSGKCASFIMQ